MSRRAHISIVKFVIVISTDVVRATLIIIRETLRQHKFLIIRPSKFLAQLVCWDFEVNLRVCMYITADRGNYTRPGTFMFPAKFCTFAIVNF